MSAPSSSIIKNRPQIKNIIATLENNLNSIVNCTVYNQINIDNMISIVMTTHDRIPQTLFTLDTINKSLSCHKIQVIIVDDSVKFINSSLFSKYKFEINYVKINNRNKTWINPCVNYNIGFKFVKGKKIIIQNSEVCHVGDIVSYLDDKLISGTYFVFDVMNSPLDKINNEIYDLWNADLFNYKNIIDFFDSRNINDWYQHYPYYSRNFHFLTAIHIDDFLKTGGFDCDFAMGISYDDDEFVYRISQVLKLKIYNVENQENKIFGVHQYHTKILDLHENVQGLSQVNKILLNFKTNYFSKTKKWAKLH